MLVLWPVIALARPAPGAQECAVLIEFENRRSRLAALRPRWIEGSRLFVFRQRQRTLNDPDMIVFIDRNAGGLAHDPVIRQGLRPGSIDRVLGGIRAPGACYNHCAQRDSS